MKLFGNRRKIQLPKEERMHFSASSFSFAIGEVFPCDNAEYAKTLLKDKQGYVVILVPGENLIKEPRAWAKALSLAGYVIVVGDEKDKRLKSFLTFLDGIIFSPIPKTLSGSICLKDSKQIRELADSLLAEGKGCLTIIPR